MFDNIESFATCANSASATMAVSLVGFKMLLSILMASASFLCIGGALLGHLQELLQANRLEKFEIEIEIEAARKEYGSRLATLCRNQPVRRPVLPVVDEQEDGLSEYGRIVNIWRARWLAEMTIRDMRGQMLPALA